MWRRTDAVDSLLLWGPEWAFGTSILSHAVTLLISSSADTATLLETDGNELAHCRLFGTSGLVVSYTALKSAS